MNVYDYINQSAYYYGAIFVSVSCLIYTLIQNNADKPQTRIYLFALMITIVTSVCDIIGIFAQPYCAMVPFARNTLFVVHYIYFVLHNLLAMLLCYYTFFATQNFSRMKRITQIIYVIPGLVSEFFVLTNPINHWSWYYDSDYNFCRNWGEYSVYISGVFYYVIALMFLMFRWYAVTKKRRGIIQVSFFIAGAGILIQLFIQPLEIELFTEAITFMGVMLSVEYDDERIDMQTRLYNRRAFLQDIRYYFDTHSRFHVVSVQLTNLESYQRMPGAMEVNELVQEIAENLNKIYPRYLTYRVTTSTFVLLLHNKDAKYVNGLTEKLSTFIQEGFYLSKPEDRLQGVVLQAEVPEELVSPHDVLLLCECEVPHGKSGMVLKKTDLQYLFERAEIERALRRGLRWNNFEVFYQLVYTADEHEIYSAEALLRLNDKTLGQIEPKVFIPAAERNGMIDELGEFVLKEVCDFWNSGVPARLKLRYININLSVIQCMQPDFAERMKAIVEDKGVAPGKITFEITESVAAEDYEYLNSVMERCKQYGFLFSMEGYGTGYSNMYSVCSLDFDEIKLDKTLLWEADQSEYGRIILENSIRMMHEMKRPVVAVGVETEEHIARLKRLGVDLLQGFYFSKPIPKHEFSNIGQNTGTLKQQEG